MAPTDWKRCARGHIHKARFSCEACVPLDRARVLAALQTPAPTVPAAPTPAVLAALAALTRPELDEISLLNEEVPIYYFRKYAVGSKRVVCGYSKHKGHERIYVFKYPVGSLNEPPSGHAAYSNLAATQQKCGTKLTITTFDTDFFFAKLPEHKKAMQLSLIRKRFRNHFGEDT